MLESTSPTIPTNTITVTNLEAVHFEKETMLKLKALAETFGDVYYFAPIKTFYRVFVVYHSTFDAQRAKALLHNTAFEGTTIRVYFGQHTEISIDPSRHYLHPPELEKNWLISPPGSPPVGWSQVREDPPNSLNLAEDLVKALIEMGQPVYQLPRPDGSFADRSHLFEAEVEDFSLGEPQDHKEVATASTGQDQVAPSSPQASSSPSSPSSSSPSSSATGERKLNQQLQGLTINTKRAQSGSPHSPHSPSSSLFPPQTPTVLAFSPAKEAGDQPFITVQDWGLDVDESPAPLKRRGTIPKTQFPSGPLPSSKCH
ncbi:carbohydrate-binding module 1 protein [Podila minutissima]|uniref:Carbohydrate-binding module 1 protein n=1 Tax=Podila minutissima TaxID=64525 RepID=A0A9P5VPW7_9FUNG|nr:carbohydrate-binding module 1 protein [Podila minutissima]